jgi:predicted nucleic acid-binding protein
LSNKYAGSKSIKVADALIAATALINNFRLFTDNKEDFNFVRGLSFYNL